MTGEEKILNAIAAMREEMTAMHGQMDSTQEGMTSIRGQMGSMREGMTSMQAGITSLQNEILKINIKLETVIEPRLDALVEGHASILERLVPRSRVDELEDRVKTLEFVIH